MYTYIFIGEEQGKRINIGDRFGNRVFVRLNFTVNFFFFFQKDQREDRQCSGRKVLIIRVAMFAGSFFFFCVEMNGTVDDNFFEFRAI